MELPRGCEYWKDEKMTSILDGADHYVHDFDGCMYGLKTRFSTPEQSLKKPWRIVSWGVEFPKMRLKCDHGHDHGQCAGRETKTTQQYTDKIIRIIVNRINQVVVRHPKFHVRSGPYQTYKHKDCEDWKRRHSMYSEGPRSDIHRHFRNFDKVKRGVILPAQSYPPATRVNDLCTFGASSGSPSLLVYVAWLRHGLCSNGSSPWLLTLPT